MFRKYHIKTVSDFLDVPDDLISSCLAAFREHLILAKRAKEVEAYLQEVGVDPDPELSAIPDSFSWEVEDGYCSRNPPHKSECSCGQPVLIEYATTMAEIGLSETDERIAHLERELFTVRASLREPIARLYGLHPDDL